MGLDGWSWLNLPPMERSRVNQNVLRTEYLELSCEPVELLAFFLTGQGAAFQRLPPADRDRLDERPVPFTLLYISYIAYI